MPFDLVLQAKRERKSIHLIVANWVLRNRDNFAPQLVKKAEYYLTKDKVNAKVDARINQPDQPLAPQISIL